VQLPPSSQLRNPRPPGRGLFFAPAASRVSLPLAIPPRKEPRLLEMILSAAALAGTAATAAVFNKRFRRLKSALRDATDHQGHLQRSLSLAYANIAALDMARSGQTPVFDIDFRSDSGEDLYLYELFARQRTGYFIECGAFDGYTGAVTYALEALGWTGLLIEPHPDRAQDCRERRPASRVVQAAVSAAGSTGTIELVSVEDPHSAHSGAYSYLAGTQAPRVKRIEERGSGRKLAVPLSTMDEVLAQSPPPRVDLAVIDVEGHEEKLFAGFDLARWKPRVLLVEEHPMGKRPELTAAISARGYVAVEAIGVNRVWIHRDEAALLARASAMSSHHVF